ncbi:MAG: hypothetical protein Fur007_07280 [Rhodoferax sp.]
MTSRTRTLALAVLLAVAVALTWRVLASRNAREAASNEEQKTALAQVEIALAASDLIAIETHELSQRIPVSGTVTAVHSAWVKARVAGEVQGLSVREGESVAAGTVLARIQAPEVHARLAQARQQAQAALAQVQTAQRALTNNQALVQQGFVSATALLTARANLEAAQATAAAAQAGADATAQAVADTVVRAPLSAQVSQRLVQNGERVMPDTRLLELIDNRSLELVVELSAAESLQVRPGQTASLRLLDGDAALPAKVLRLNPGADRLSRRVSAYLSLPPHSGLRHGLLMQGHIETGRVQGLAVPLSALRTDAPLPYLQWFDGHAVRHTTVRVQAHGFVGDEAWVTVQGLPAQTQVLRASVGRLRDGTAARLQAATRPVDAP